MNLIFSLVAGFAKVLRGWQAAALLALLQLVLAFLLSSPMAAEMHGRWDSSLVDENLASRPQLQSTVWEEALPAGRELSGTLLSRPYLFAFAVIYIVLNILVLAGVVPLYTGLDLKFTWDRFWVNASRYFRVYIGLAVLAALLFWAADLSIGLFEDVVEEALAASDDEPMIFVTRLLVSGGLRLFVFSLIVLVFQYAKVISAAEEIRNVIYLVRRAFFFISRYFVSVFLLFAILSLLDLGLAAADVAIWYFALPDLAPPLHWAWLIGSTLLMVTIKLSFYACQLLLFVETLRRADDKGRISSYSDELTVNY